MPRKIKRNIQKGKQKHSKSRRQPDQLGRLLAEMAGWAVTSAFSALAFAVTTTIFIRKPSAWRLFLAKVLITNYFSKFTKKQP